MSGVKMAVFSSVKICIQMVFSPQRIATGYQQLLPNKYITNLCFVWWYLSADGPSHIKYQHFRFSLRAGKSSNTSQPQIRSNFLCTFAMIYLLHKATCQYFASSCFTAIEVLNETDKMALKHLAPKHRRGGQRCTGQTQATPGSGVSWVQRCT